MNELEDVLAALLLSNSAIKDFVGNNCDWNRSAQGVVGYRIILFLISAPVIYRMKGPVRHYMSRVQIDCRAETDLQVRNLSKAVDGFMSGYKGEFAGVFIDGAFRDGKQSATERENSSGSSSIQWFARKLDYRFYWAPAQP